MDATPLPPADIVSTFKDRVTAKGKTIAKRIALSALYDNSVGLSRPFTFGKPLHSSNEKIWKQFCDDNQMTDGHARAQVSSLIDQGFVEEVPFIEALRQRELLLTKLDVKLRNGRDLMRLSHDPSETQHTYNALTMVKRTIAALEARPDKMTIVGHQLTYVLKPALFESLFLEGTTNQQMTRGFAEPIQRQIA